MKYLLTITLYFFFSASHADSSLVDPDSLDSSMPVVSYLIPASNLKIAAYYLGAPSKLSVKLCSKCIEKTYLLDPKAELKRSRILLKRDILTKTILNKKFQEVRLVVDRRIGSITSLHIGASPYDEMPEMFKTNPLGNGVNQ
ncbi:MAG: hypothetical protein KBT75_00760 [Oleispira antarctica]|nr:hypothetical protein [Oleispira antarctica]MBQ0791188.1 hypothetical protein [Oleispira antarctica]